ncbi:MAG: hypothetical protein GY853_00950 [PVC group bacterium]|nr:hypothetical protein [PVC group bacterium]
MKTLEEILNILDRRCRESGGDCKNCIFKSSWDKEGDSINCFLWQLMNLFNFKIKLKR